MQVSGMLALLRNSRRNSNKKSNKEYCIWTRIAVQSLSPEPHSNLPHSYRPCVERLMHGHNYSDHSPWKDQQQRSSASQHVKVFLGLYQIARLALVKNDSLAATKYFQNPTKNIAFDKEHQQFEPNKKKGPPNYGQNILFTRGLLQNISGSVFAWMGLRIPTIYTSSQYSALPTRVDLRTCPIRAAQMRPPEM